MILDLVLFIPELFIILSSLSTLILELYYNVSKRSLRTLQALLSLESFLIAFVLMLLSFSKDKLLFSSWFELSYFTQCNKLLVVLCSIVFFMFLTKSYFNSQFKHSCTFLLSCTIFSTILMISLKDLISLYLLLETQALGLYGLAGLNVTSRFSNEASLKYFILGALSSSFLICGISLIYSQTGSTDLIAIELLILNEESLSDILSVGFGFLLVGFLFKLTIVPFHSWAPSLYEGVPFILTVFFMLIPKLGVLTVFIKIVPSLLLNETVLWQDVLLYSGSLSVLAASLAALYQKKIKRFLAYSSISQFGHLMLCLGTGTLLGFNAFYFYLITYTITLFGIFSVLLNFKVSYILHLWMPLNKKDSVKKTGLLLLILSLAGLPPLAGFLSKFYVLLALWSAGFYALTILIILTGILSTVYYLRLLKVAFFEANNTSTLQKFSHKELEYLIATVTAAIAFILLSPNFLLLKISHCVLSI
jgi:NADH-quinone oxidoreductase subunit N